jgi:UDP-N-acetylglucosamine acyltransferase
MSGNHPTAIVDPTAEVDPAAEIGPYAIVGPGVRLAAGVVLKPHAHVTGNTEIGEESVIYSFASIGEAPQDKKYQGEENGLVIGKRNVLREYSTVHPGTAAGGGITRLGDDNLLMIGAHVAHDCQLGSHIVMGNEAALAEHVEIEDYAVLSPSTLVHQFCRIGESAMLGATSGTLQDLAPYVIAMWIPARVLRVNKINLERRGFSPERIKDVERAYRIIFRSKLSPDEAFAKVREELKHSPEAEHMCAFLEKSERGFVRVR